RAGVGPNDCYSERTAGTFTGPFERVARLGDGWITGIVTTDEYRQTLAHIRDLARERYGRALGPEFRAVLNCFVHVGPSVAAAREAGKAFLEAYHPLPFDDATLRRWLIHGPPERCAERIQTYVDAGVTSFQLVLASADQRAQLRAVAEQVRPRVAAPASPTAGALRLEGAANG